MLLRDLLKSLDAYVITTYDEGNRFIQTEENVSKVFKYVSPFLAYDVSDEKTSMEYATSFQQGAYELKSKIKELGTNSVKHKSLTNFGTRKLTPNNIDKYARTESLFRTHKDILELIADSNTPAVILEDDVWLREELYEKDIVVPEFYDVLVIGGNVTPMSDIKAFADGVYPSFKHIRPHKNNGHGAYATVYTPKGAKETLKALNTLHTHLDYARKPALCEWTESYKLVPDLLTVRGHSIRDKNIKEENRPITREEAIDYLNKKV